MEEFGVWFGKPLWRKKIGERLVQSRQHPGGRLREAAADGGTWRRIEGETETPKEELPTLKPLDKIIVAFAGPLFSFLLALTLACIVWCIGTPTSQPDTTTRIGLVKPGGPADKAGLKMGDTVLAIDGHPVKQFIGQTNSVIWYIVSLAGRHDRLPHRARRAADAHPLGFYLR